jgi:hypothetical protein
MSRNAQDQVARQFRFTGAHPEVTIAVDREDGTWRASWPGAESATRELTGPDLKSLLDQLDAAFG